MVEIVFITDKNGDFHGFHAKGHAGYAESGEDIVCAAISAILQTTLLGLQDAACIQVDFRMDDGDMELHLPKNLAMDAREKSFLLLKTMRLGLESIAVDQEKYLVIKDRRI